jgi:isoleucyl-tRNA synthetase
MPFAKVETQNVDFPALERHVLKFWNDEHIFEKRKALNAGKPRWSFLDGPITANNPMGVHHAWGRTYKDAYNRYFAMTGHDLRYQQGFDCQGLWVEVEVEKELKLESKRDIENIVPGDREQSIDAFVLECKNRVNKFARVQTNQSIRLGFWMNWDVTDEEWARDPDHRRSYFTMAERNNYAIWAFLKKCHARKMVYRGYDVMPWCGRCGVGISEQEMKEGYRLVEHRACFVKFPLVGRPGENLLVWTTTPWTLTSNVGAAVNPELTYLKTRLKGEVYYVAKGAFKLNRMESAGDDEGEPGASATGGRKPGRDWLPNVPHLSSIEQHFKSKAGKEPVEIVGELKGSDLLGWEYVGPFDDLPAQQHEYGFPEEVARVTQQSGKWPARTAAASHCVISGGDDVTETEGTGIVHTAPGCGAIDYQWGRANGLPPVAPIDDSGVFVSGFGPFVGMNAADPATADAVFDELKKKDRLFATERYVHRYPHCWRCKTELLYRLVDEWFINMGPQGSEDGFRGEIMTVVRDPEVRFLPEAINGTARELDWLKNMGDWMISKKRYWGLSLPIWVDEKDPTQFEVIGSRDELKARAIEGWAEFDGHTPHRPWVDKIVLRNLKTGNRMLRIPDVGNPWLDAGIVAFSTMPADWYPADFITESFPGQFRNWFYSLLAMSTMMSGGRPPFKTLLGFATVQDQFGKAMHKSDGNSIEFDKAADEGFELFHDIDPKKDAKEALKDLPKGYVSTREELVRVKAESKKRVFAKYKPIGADVMRWLYCRQNPSANLNFGPEPTDEVRRSFVIKLWNCYALFCNYAIADGFDPSAAPVPMAERPDIDRWIVSDLQALIRSAREAFEAFNVMAFCLEAERFIDEKLSNWYIRVNRDRFWSKNAELDAAGLKDKLSAYQTLYGVLTTLCKLIAPCVPFLSDTMWRNLRAQGDPVSVHLCDYPRLDESLADEELSGEMQSVMEVVSLGMAARQQQRIKVRQPLNQLRIHTTNQVTSRMTSKMQKYWQVIAEEMNVRNVEVGLAPSFQTKASYRPVANRKVLGPKAGPHLNEVVRQLEATQKEALIFLSYQNAPLEIIVSDRTFLLEPQNDFVWQLVPPDSEKWAEAHTKDTQVLLDTNLTDELILEGLSRDIIRQVQEARKNAGLDVADRIALHLAAAGDLGRAIAAHRPAIATATQAIEWSEGPIPGGYAATVKVEGQELAINLRKV